MKDHTHPGISLMLFISSVPLEIPYEDSIDNPKIEQKEDRGRPIT